MYLMKTIFLSYVYFCVLILKIKKQQTKVFFKNLPNWIQFLILVVNSNRNHTLKNLWCFKVKKYKILHIFIIWKISSKYQKEEVLLSFSVFFWIDYFVFIEKIQNNRTRKFLFTKFPEFESAFIEKYRSSKRGSSSL